MDEITLFEIPIYSMSEKTFDKRWNKKKSNLLNEFVSNGWKEYDADHVIHNLFYPKPIWKYNQIVGFIVISITDTDVLLDVYCTMDKKIHFDSKIKHSIINWSVNGTHFYAVNKSEEEIKQETLEMLSMIEAEFFNPGFHVDRSVFDNLFRFVNIKHIMESCSK